MKMKRMLRRIGTIVVAPGLTLAGIWTVTSKPAVAADMTIYKSPWCECCNAWVDHLQANGITVAVERTGDPAPVKARFAVPDDLQSCHTATIEGYTIEGHVPAADIRRLLAQRPAGRGLAVPGMPAGSPGTEQGDAKEPYVVILFGDAAYSEFAKH